MKLILSKIKFRNLQKELKSTVPNTMDLDLSEIKSKISDMSEIKILIYTIHNYNLQTRIMPFPGYESLLIEVKVILVQSTRQKKTFEK